MKPTIYNTGPYNLRRSMSGLTLIELMISMVLGLLLVSVAAGVMISNSQSFRTGKSLSQIQNSARMGFELMARDIRQAGSIPCGSGINIDNLLDNPLNPTLPWYLNWENNGNGQFTGYSANDTISNMPTPLNRVSGTEAVAVSYIESYGSSLVASGIDSYRFSRAQSQFNSGDVVFVCDSSKASVFIANISAPNSNNIVTITAAASTTPIGNANQQPGTFEKNAVVGKLKSRVWYVGDNSNGNKSLYLAELSGSTLDAIEIAAGISDLKFEYRLGDTSDFKSAAAIGNDWPLVNAVKITYTLEGQDENVSTDSANSGRLSRSFSSIVALRSRIL